MQRTWLPDDDQSILAFQERKMKRKREENNSPKALDDLFDQPPPSSSFLEKKQKRSKTNSAKKRKNHKEVEEFFFNEKEKNDDILSDLEEEEEEDRNMVNEEHDQAEDSNQDIPDILSDGNLSSVPHPSNIDSLSQETHISSEKNSFSDETSISSRCEENVSEDEINTVAQERNEKNDTSDQSLPFNLSETPSFNISNYFTAKTFLEEKQDENKKCIEPIVLVNEEPKRVQEFSSKKEVNQVIDMISVYFDLKTNNQTHYLNKLEDFMLRNKNFSQYYDIVTKTPEIRTALCSLMKNHESVIEKKRAKHTLYKKFFQLLVFHIEDLLTKTQKNDTVNFLGLNPEIIHEIIMLIKNEMDRYFKDNESSALEDLLIQDTQHKITKYLNTINPSILIEMPVDPKLIENLVARNILSYLNPIIYLGATIGIQQLKKRLQPYFLKEEENKNEFFDNDPNSEVENIYPI